MSYFFIAFTGTTDTSEVFEDTRRAGTAANIIKVSQWNGSDQQLWRWTSDGCLENKNSRFVICVMGESTRVGAHIITSSKSENSNRWICVDGMIRSQKGADLNITKFTDGFLGVWCTLQDNYAQKWRLIPQPLWSLYTSYLLNTNQITKLVLVRTILLDYLGCVSGNNISEYEADLRQCIALGMTCSNELDKEAEHIGRAKVAGGGLGILGGLGTIGGIVLAPFSAGTSLILTAGGALTAGVGGLTSIGATIADHCCDGKKEVEKIRPLIENVRRTSNMLYHLLHEVSVEIQEANRLLAHQRQVNNRSIWNEAVFWAKNAGSIRKEGNTTLETLGRCSKAAKKVKEFKALTNAFETKKAAIAAEKFKELKDFYNVIKADRANALKAVVTTASDALEAKNTAVAATKFKELEGLTKILKAEGCVMKSAMSAATEAAETAAAGGFKIPVSGKVILEAGSNGAKVFATALSVVGIAFGINDVVSGVEQVQKGSSVAEFVRASLREIENQGNSLIAAYREFQRETTQ